jgi:hypothetical protein
MTKYTSTRPASGTKDAAGVGYITIPAGIDKRKFINHCFRTGTISLLLENGGVIDDVLISKSALNEIEFPEKFNKKGSLLIWINQPRKLRPIVIGSLSKTNEFVNFNANKSSLKRATKNFVSEVLVDAQNGSIVITSNSSIEGGGDIYIISTNKKKNSKFKIQVSGSIEVETPDFITTASNKISFVVKNKDEDDTITKIEYEKGVGLSYADEFGNECSADSGGFNISPSSKFSIGSGEESIILGDSFKSIFDDLTDMISKLADTCAKIQVGTSMGPSTVPTNAADLTQISQDINDIKKKYPDFLSQISFTE